VVPPDDDKPGTMVVSHPEEIDPVALANAIGIEQPARDEEDEAAAASEDVREDPDEDAGEA
jgi:hypothetical protein